MLQDIGQGVEGVSLQLVAGVEEGVDRFTGSVEGVSKDRLHRFARIRIDLFQLVKRLELLPGPLEAPPRGQQVAGDDEGIGIERMHPDLLPHGGHPRPLVVDMGHAPPPEHREVFGVQPVVIPHLDRVAPPRGRLFEKPIQRFFGVSPRG